MSAFLKNPAVEGLRRIRQFDRGIIDLPSCNRQDAVLARDRIGSLLSNASCWTYQV